MTFAKGASRERGRPSDNEKEQRHAEGRGAGDDLAARDRREEDADRDKARAHEKEPEVARDDGPRLGIRENREHRRVEERAGDHDGEHGQRGEVLAHDGREIAQGVREKEFEGSLLLFLGKEPHRQKRENEKKHDAQLPMSGRMTPSIRLRLSPGYGPRPAWFER